MAEPTLFRLYCSQVTQTALPSYARHQSQASVGFRERQAVSTFWGNYRGRCSTLVCSGGLRRTKADSPWSIKPASKSDLDIAPNPKLSHRVQESTRSRVFHLSMPSGAERKEMRMENIFGRARVGMRIKSSRSLRALNRTERSPT